MKTDTVRIHDMVIFFAHVLASFCASCIFFTSAVVTEQVPINTNFSLLPLPPVRISVI